MNVREQVLEVGPLGDHAGLVPALPKSAHPAPPPVVVFGNPALDSSHMSAKRRVLGLHDEVIVIAQQTPGENRQSVLIGNEGDRIDPPVGFTGLVEHKLAARCSAVDVVDHSGCEDAGLSRHRRSPFCVDGIPS